MSKHAFALVKPDGVRRGLVGECLSRFEKRGFAIEAIKKVTLTGLQVKQLYQKFTAETFFTDLSLAMQAGPCVAILFTHDQFDNPSAVARTLAGAFDLISPGTIRGDYATSFRHNVIHVSDDEFRAVKEASFVMGAT